MKKIRIAHMILSVSNWDKSAKFYDALMLGMGFKVGLDEKGGWGNIRAYRKGEHGLYIKYEKRQKYGKFNRFPGLNHIAFAVSSKDDVKIIHRLVKTLGVKITRPPRKYSQYTRDYYAFYFRDPDGMPLEVAYI